MGVTVGNVRQTQFDVSWNDITGANSYNIMATPTDSMLTSVSRNSVLENSITLTGLEPGQTYRVTVVGNYNTGSGEPSAAVEQVTGILFYFFVDYAYLSCIKKLAYTTYIYLYGFV